MQNPPDPIAEITRAYADPDAIARQLGNDHHRIIRTIGSDAPLTLLRAAGFTPIRVTAPEGPTPLADALAGPATGRRRGHQLLEWLLNPEFAETPILITRVDAEQPQLFAVLRELRRLGEPGPQVFAMLDFLHQPRASSRRYNRQRIDQLIGWLTRLGGKQVTDNDIATVAEVEARLAALIVEAQALRTHEAPLLSGTQMLRIIGAAAILPPDSMIATLKSLLGARETLKPHKGKRLWLAGSALEQDRVYLRIEQQGAVIVGETHDWGLPRLAMAPPTSLEDLSDPLRYAPLTAGSFAKTAAECIAQAREASADAIIHLSLDQDEAAPWLLPMLERGAGALPIERQIDPPPQAATLRPAGSATRAKPVRSIKLLRAGADFGSYQRDWFAGVRAQVAAGSPFAVVNANAPQEILRALDIPFVVNQWWASIVAAKQQSKRYRSLLLDHGFPDDVEPYSTQALAAAFDDDAELAPWCGLPRPDFVHAVTSSDATTGIFEAMARADDAQAFLYERTIDPRPAIETRWWEVMSDHWDDALEPERLDLLVDELKQLIAQLETATGRLFDDTRFRAVMDLVNEQEEFYQATRALIAQTVPAPISIVDSMPATMVPQWHRGTVWARDAARAFHDEVAARVAQGQGVVEHEHVRLMWVGRGLWSDTAFYQKWEQSHGAVFVWSMYLGLAADGYIRRHDSGRDPLRALAARFLTMGDELRMPSWAGPWHVHEAKTHQIDGALALADADPFVVRALRSAGIPVLELGVDNFAATPDEIASLDSRVTAFIERSASHMAAKRLGERP